MPAVILGALTAAKGKHSDIVVAVAKASIPDVWRALLPNVVFRNPPLFWLVVAFPPEPLALVGPPVIDGWRQPHTVECAATSSTPNFCLYRFVIPFTSARYPVKKETNEKTVAHWLSPDRTCQSTIAPNRTLSPARTCYMCSLTKTMKKKSNNKAAVRTSLGYYEYFT